MLWGVKMASCILCDSEAIINKQESASRTIYNCKNCGVFVISDLQEKEIAESTNEIASYLMSRKMRKAEDTVLISFEKANIDKDYLQLTARQIVDFFPKNFTEQMDMALKNIEKMSRFAGDEIKIEDLSVAPLFYVRQRSLEALTYVIKSMHRAGFLEVNYFSGAYMPCAVTITPKGWDRLYMLKQNKNDKNELFFCSVKKETVLSRQFINAIDNVSKECGYNATNNFSERVEAKVSNELIVGVKDAKIVVCDFTEPVGEIYYAAALAEGLGKLCILTCHESAKEKLQIDTNQFRVILWDNQETLYIEILSAIKAKL